MTYYVSSGTLNLTKPKPKPQAHNAPAYQISAKSGNEWLSF